MTSLRIHLVLKWTEHIGHVYKMPVYGYNRQRFQPLLHQYGVSLSKTFNPHCFSRLSLEVSTRWERPHEWCLLSAMSVPEEIALKNNAFFLFNTFRFVTMSTKPCFKDEKISNALIFYIRRYFPPFAGYVITLHCSYVKCSDNE